MPISHLAKAGVTITSEKKSFENVDRQLTCDLWPRSTNDLDL